MRSCLVHDNSIGVPEEHQGMIFRIFKRLHRRAEYGGGRRRPDDRQEDRRAARRRDLAHLQIDEGSTFWFTLGKVDPNQPPIGHTPTDHYDEARRETE